MSSTYGAIKARYRTAAECKTAMTVLVGRHAARHGSGLFQDDTLRGLMAFHPERKVPAAVRGFRVMADDKFGKHVLHFVDARGRSDTVSYISCVTNVFRRKGPQFSSASAGADRQEVANAFRDATFDGARKAFYNQHHDERASCHCCDGQRGLQVDHCGDPFAKILDDYLSERGLRLDDICAERVSNVTCAIVDPRIDLREWLAYHDARAQFVFLCGPCNSRKGSGGYRHALRGV